MKRMLTTAIASSMLALAAPSMASAAHHPGHHHGVHHASAHSRHARPARLVRFAALGAPGATSGTSATPPASSTTPTGESAGTVTSFSGGVLTITLTDKTVVSGNVTERTELGCQPAASSTGTGSDESSGDDQSESDGTGHGDTATAQTASHEQDSQDGSGDGNQQAGEESCTTAALVPGAVVREAELRMSSGGAVWEKVDLVH
jgi:hypothetical protein